MGAMSSRVKLFLIRHGETVDNVAQLYAGSRDSALTNHGFHQATRLGLHFETQGIRFTHFFSSRLQRAARTAGLIRQAQASLTHANNVPEVVQLPVLMERDFGSYEGKKWNEKPPALNVKEHCSEDGKNVSSFSDVESKESMAQRADAFLDNHLLPLLEEAAGPSHDKVVAIVSHGIMLSTLWKRFLLRLAPKSVSFSPSLRDTARLSLEHLGGWSNTGYLELCMTRSTPALPPVNKLLPRSISESVAIDGAHTKTEGDVDFLDTSPIARDVAPSTDRCLATVEANVASHSRDLANGWTTLIETVNGKDHLRGIKRTGGGVGSARHDSSQKNIDSFFKRRKTD